jgi:hypothetical protein
VSTESESLSIGGWLQPAFEYRGRDDDSDLKGFFLRRARVDLTGSVMDGTIRFRVYPEFAGTPGLRDGWVEVRGERGVALRMGQQTVPFDLQREKSMGRAHFGERALAARRFEVSGGRDVGVVGSWRGGNGDRLLSLGVFNGRGPNRRELGPSPLLSGRGIVSFGGPIASAETDLGRSESPVITVALGFMAADESILRPRPGSAADQPADWTGWTGDVHARWSGFSVAGAWFSQFMSLATTVPQDVDGNGWFLSAGWVFPGSGAEIALRHSQATWDQDLDLDPEKETGLGLTLFHRAHEVQSRFQLTFEEHPTSAGGGRATLLTVEHQILLGG